MQINFISGGVISWMCCGQTPAGQFYSIFHFCTLFEAIFAHESLTEAVRPKEFYVFSGV